MDRRVVTGLVGIALAGVAVEARAQSTPGRDPSAQPSVGLGTIPSIEATINGGSGLPGTAPPPASALPASPVGRGPAATIPRSPVGSEPVSLTPLEPIHRSVSQGFGSGAIGSIFRRPGPRPRSGVTPSASSPASSPAPAGSGPPPIHAHAHAWEAAAASSMPPAARPSPYAGRRPESARVQAEPSSLPTFGRVAPFADARPASARPQAPALAPAVASYRPPESAAPEPIAPTSAGPKPLPPPPTGPASASASAPEPLPSPPTPSESAPEPLPEPPPTSAPELPKVEAAAPPPLGVDPLQGIAPAPPPVVVVAEPAPAPAPSPSPALSDPALRRTSQDESAVRTTPRPLPYASIRAAAVGDEIITINELAAAVKDQMREMVGEQAARMSPEELHEVKNQVASTVLNRMIDQALVLQVANRKMLGQPKAKQMFDEFVEKQWKSDELPVLYRKTATSNIHELKVKLASEGKSYDSIKQAFRKKLTFNEFLRMEIRNKVTSDLIELRAYYNDHLDKYEQPARMTWREIEVSIARNGDRAAALKKAEGLLARLAAGENFDAVARAGSDGPTASKGGLYVDMQPGSYGLPVVNDELNKIPTGQLSGLLETPGSFHIVRVDSRREKGPLRFDEVQEKIRGQVLEQNFQRAVEEYLAKLRTKTLIRTMFDNTASDPDLARRADPSVRPASGAR